MLLIWYPKCSTCQKAAAYLKELGLSFDTRDIKAQPPTVGELERWQPLSGLPLARFFNTSGLQYRALGLKEKLPGLDRPAQLELLASDGMLVRRPLLIGEGWVLVGFRPKEWAEKLEG